jgi:hypothetical protein
MRVDSRRVTLWLPVIPMQVGLVLKPRPQEPWTPCRMAAALFEAGVPRESISIYPGAGDRLNIGPISTIKLDWLQPHEGNIVELLCFARAHFRAAM